MGKEQMSTWIDAKITEEKERRDSILRFKAAFESFLNELTPKLEAELKPFREHFPNDKVRWVPIFPGGIVELHHEFSAKTSATVTLSADAVRRLFLIRFSLSPHCSREIPAELVDGKLSLDLNAVGIPPGGLAEYILLPVLFPGLVNNPAALDNL